MSEPDPPKDDLPSEAPPAETTVPPRAPDDGPPGEPAPVEPEPADPSQPEAPPVEAAVPPQPPEASAPPEPAPEPPRTVFMPPPAERTAAPPASSPPGPPPTSYPSGPTLATGRVEVGVVLNHIYEVKRLIGRGGMGEVYEGVNVNADERVAIKVMLPSLAADPNVQAMFRKEARTLTRISHPAIVNYRVLANEPTLGVLYIVTEFIDGVALSDVLKELKPSEGDLAQLLRRLAEGLRAAHELGAIHRDMSPDNVLLPDGRLDRAKVIDFGIAKDLDASKGTIIGDGFAGKLGYVAPEQFGDFGREIGPWTDVYSLGLVILALATGGKLDMGSTLVEAIDRRRAGCDLSAVPADLRPVLDGMLQADPAKRLRSMDEVIEALDRAKAATAPPAGGATVFAPAWTPPASSTTAGKPPAARSRLPLMIGGGAAALVAVVAAVFFLRPQDDAKAPAGDAPAAAAKATGPVAEARKRVEATLPTIGCSWLDVIDVSQQGQGVSVSLTGVAGQPAAAQSAIDGALKGGGLTVANIDQRQVAPVSSAVCRVLDGFRAFKAPTAIQGAKLSSAQREYEIMPQPQGGRPEARAVIEMAIREPSLDFALLGIEPSG
ncbi:MAG TPA: protein kinase, partial [Phenylobacterium sp.]|nr:protein kinase [Phenylobacterium sp.]